MFFSFKDSIKTGGWIILLLSIIGIVAIVFGLFSSRDMLFQSVAVLLSVMVTAIVTGALLERQTSGEEKREMNLKIYENKIAVYSRFITKMWGVLSDNQPVTAEQMMSLRKEVFNQLIFYADETVIDKISKEIKRLAKTQIKDEVMTGNLTYRQVFAEITTVLREDIAPKLTKKNTAPEGYIKVMALWSAFGSSEEDGPAGTTNSPGTDEVPKEVERRIDDCIHFCVFDEGYQKALWTDITKTENLYPLFLCEYGESWRTDFIKNRINYDDIVFLFQRGGLGYAGMFRAKGYVVFEANENETSCKIRFYNEAQEKAINVPEQIEKYQVQKLLDDGATYCSYLLTEPIVLYEDLNSGVGSISTYRRTVSSYDPHYAWMTAARFKYEIEQGDADITVNKPLLDQLVTDNQVVSAQQDEDGNWQEW